MASNVSSVDFKDNGPVPTKKGQLSYNSNKLKLFTNSVVQVLAFLSDLSPSATTPTRLSFSWAGKEQSFIELEETEDDFEVMARFYYAGTITLGIHTQAKFIFRSEDDGCLTSIRIYDQTNAKEIALVTTTSDDFTIVVDSTLTNLPTGEAVFEVQGKADDEDTEIHFCSVELS